MSGPTVFVPALNITVPVANISTPLIFLTPGQAQDLNLAVYLHIGATGVMIWDFLDNLRNDFTMPVTPKTRIPTIMYFVVRLTLVAYCLGRAALLTLPIENCARIAHVLNALLAINGILETGLCYLRVVMVYNRHPFVVTFYSCVWISAVAMTLTIFKTFSASHIPNTHYCVESIGGPLAIPTLAIWVANDTMIYIGIAYRIYNIFQTYDFGPSMKRRVAIMVFGASLPTLGSKIVLLESQLYCL
ncbi:hypothetical protein BDN70DRAFT_703680 [Pholiota conissans]|uniref:Uncharacterized protein n=1 Tax=Pholiota conissans TaxID=109636 RepID=A0A9P6CU52_9AGAR|nr:hypothetical protein BDN70DRAFT_703680 [Pholiota conissans]